MKSKSILGVLLVAVTVLGAVMAAQGAGFKFKYKDINVAGAAETDTYANNKNAQITGDYLDSSGIIHGVIIRGKTATTIDNPKGSSTIGQGINGKGDVVGYYTNTKTGIITGFLYTGGKFSDVAPKGSLETEASGINNKGDIVGLYLDSNGVQHGFLWNGKKFKDIDPKGSQATTAWGVNNAGLITVFMIDSNGAYESFSTADKGKTFTKIKDPKEDSTIGTVCHTPNTAGDIVGTYFDSSQIAHGFLLSGGKYYNFNDPKAPSGGPGTRGDGLSDNEIIVGRYGEGNGNGGYGFEAVAKPK